MINLLVLDPHPVVRCGFKTFLKGCDFVKIVKCVENIEQAMEIVDNHHIDILITEMVLNDESPINLIAQAKKSCPEIEIIIYTSLDENIYSIPLLKAGAIGFLSKKVEACVLAEALSKIHNHKLYITNNFNNQLNLEIDLERPRNSFGKLSAREIEVLKYLTDGKRNIEIAQQLKINQKTVNTYKNRMMQKLQVNNMFDLYLQAKNMNIV